MLQFLRHSPYTAQPAGEEIDEVEGFGTPVEMLSLSFSIRAREAVPEIAVSVSDLKCGQERIPETSIDVFVVKVWQQAGVGVYQSAPVAVSELLVKDDRVDLTDGYTRKGNCGHWKHFLRRSFLYLPPDVRLDGAALTSLDADESRQFWLSIKIPEGTTPGTYCGQVRVQHGASERTLEVRVEVLPIKLLEASQDLFLWFKGTLDCRRPQHYVSEGRFRSQLQDIYEHGFRSISLNEYEPRLLQRALDIAASIGFKRNVLLTAFNVDFAKLNFHHFTPIWYLSDEIDVRGKTFTLDHIEKWERMSRTGFRTMSSLVSASFAARLLKTSDIGCPPDVFSFYLPANLNCFSNDATLPRSDDHKTYYYWHSHMEKPDVHRVLAGYYLWKSNADGISPYCYQHLPSYPFSPFDDFDEWERGLHHDVTTGNFKDHMTTYPARLGSIPTLQWKGLADGIYDLRYLTTLAAVTAQLESSSSLLIRQLVHESRRRVEQFLERIDLKQINIASETEVAPYRHVQSEEYSRFREQMARDIVALEALARAEQSAKAMVQSESLSELNRSCSQ